MLLERPFKRLPKDPDPAVFPVADPAFETPRAGVDRFTVTWVGHSTVLLQLDGMNILTDPMWSQRASPLRFAGPRRWVPPGIRFGKLPPIDVVLQSHNHYDHLDDVTVRDLAARDPEATWLVPLGLGDFVRRRGVRRIEELDWWEEASVGGLRLASTPARHFSARGLGDRNATLWCGWVAAAAGRRVFFAGDTGYHPEFARIGERHGPFDVTLLPIGAYEPRWFMRPAHMNPAESVQAFLDLCGGAAGSDTGVRSANDAAAVDRRSVMVPIHHSTFKLTDEAMDEPARLVRRAWDDAGLSRDDLWLLAHGETRSLI